jgi:predicted AAA+ superfamily ATPase
MILRKMLGKLLGELEKLFVSILIGPRQVGKSL